MRIDQETSAQIRVCRVLCIFFMMYVHVWPGVENLQPGHAAPLFSVLDFVLVDLLGRASVPALTLVSGFLMVASLGQKGALAVNKGRVTKILVPMITWNLVALVLAWLIFKLGHPLALWDQVQAMDPLSIVAFKVLALNNDGGTVALNFLRDLMVCGLLVVPMVWAVRTLGLGAVAIVGVMSVVTGFEPVIYRANIPVFFMLGIYCALRRGSLSPSRGAVGLVALLVPAVIAIDLLAAFDPQDPSLLPASYELLRRLVVSAAFLMAAFWIAGTAARSFFFRCERSIFLVFLSHSALFMLSWGAWKRLMGADLDVAYVLFFLASPVVCLAAITLIPRAVWHVVPGWLQVLIRGDVIRAKAPPRGEAAAATVPKAEG